MDVYGSGLYGAELYGVTTFGAADYNTGRDMSFNPIREEVFISRTSALTYIFGKNGMSSIPAEITDIAYNRDILLMHSPDAAIVQNDITFSTDIINFGTQGLNAIEWINLQADIVDDVFSNDVGAILLIGEHAHRDNTSCIKEVNFMHMFFKMLTESVIE